MSGLRLFVFCPLLLMTVAAQAQPVAYRLVAGGEVQPWTARAAWTPDSLHAAVADALRWFSDRGYALAALDSARQDSSEAFVLYATRGPYLPVREVVVTGAAHFTEIELQARMDTRPGQPLVGRVLSADLDRILSRYAAAGYGLAQIRVEALALVSEGAAPVGLRLVLHVEEGSTVVLREVVLGPDSRTRPGYAARLLGLAPGTPLRYFSPAEVAARLERSTLFTSIGAPELLLHPDGTATLRLDVTEAAPGAFDVVVGVLPPEGTRQRATLIGSGHLLLRNLFGLGHRYEVRLDRLPGRTSTALAQAAVPYVLGLPLQVEARFEGTQQDSTLGAQRYRGALAYGGEGREVLATVSRERIKPGVEGARLRGGQQRVARSSATFAGIGFRLGRVDAPFNPRRGYVLETLLERGQRYRVRTVEVDGQPVRARTSTRQERLTLTARLYRPLARQLVLALGAEGYALRSDAYEEGELFRIGGATTLRGYDEDRFRARYAARSLAEVRLLLDRRSYAFVFADAGYLDQPEAPGVSSLRGFYPGYGLGVQVSTGVGLVLVTYAAAPESGLTAGRVHLGLSLGL